MYIACHDFRMKFFRFLVVIFGTFSSCLAAFFMIVSFSKLTMMSSFVVSFEFFPADHSEHLILHSFVGYFSCVCIFQDWQIFIVIFYFPFGANFGPCQLGSIFIFSSGIIYREDFLFYHISIVFHWPDFFIYFRRNFIVNIFQFFLGFFQFSGS